MLSIVSAALFPPITAISAVGQANMNRGPKERPQRALGSISYEEGPLGGNDRVAGTHGAQAMVNAILNGSTACFRATGYAFIRKRNIIAHRTCRVTAFVLSSLFLVTYLLHHAQVGSVPFQDEGWIRGVYSAVLVPHVALAMVIVPLALLTIYRGRTERRKFLNGKTLRCTSSREEWRTTKRAKDAGPHPISSSGTSGSQVQTGSGWPKSPNLSVQKGGNPTVCLTEDLASTEERLSPRWSGD